MIFDAIDDKKKRPKIMIHLFKRVDFWIILMLFIFVLKKIVLIH